MKKLLSIFAFAVIFSSLGLAGHYTFPSKTVEYGGGEVQLTVECDSTSGTCNDAFGNTFHIEICGEEAANTKGNLGPTSPAEKYEFSFKIPEDVACTIGDETIKFVPETPIQHMGEGGQLTIQPKGGMDPHKGKYLVVQTTQTLTSDKVFDFFLTNDESHPIGSGIPDPGIQLRNNMPLDDQEAWAKPKEGFTKGNLGPIIGNCPTGDGVGEVCQSKVNLQFANDFENKFGNSDYLNQLNTATPLHGDGGSYQPQGQIIYGEKVGTNEKNFFVCREGQTSTVAVTDGSDSQTRICDSGEWVTPRGNIRVDFFESEPKEEKVGFEIKKGQIDKWSQTFGNNPFTSDSNSGKLTIKGECWHGTKGQRPAPSRDDLRTEFSRTVESSGPTIVALDVPVRDSLSGGTGASQFACNYGFQQQWYSGDLIIDAVSDGQYIVQGSDTPPPIDSGTGSAGEISTLTNNELSNAVSQTDTSINNPFQHFPESDPQKHPIEVWQNNYD